MREPTKAFESLEAALKKQPQDFGLYYDAACAYALASQAVARKDQARSKSLSERALSLLRKAIQNGYSDYRHMQQDADLDPLRQLPAFADIMKAGHLDRSYAAVWAGDFRFEASPFFGLDTAAQLQQCRELVAQGYRMVALSVARISPGGLPITASVWHRPVITDETRDRLAERQARAAIALLRMGKANEVMPLTTPQCRPPAEELHRQLANPLGADPKLIAAELERLPATASPTPAQGQQLMDAILFHPETSMRRALILALGTYGTEGLSSSEREPLIGKLLDLYRNDPDSGIHGAAEWTLRQWKQQEKIKELDAELMKLKDWGEPPLVRQRAGADLRRDRGAGRVPHGIAADRDGTFRRERDAPPGRHPPPLRHRRPGGHGRAVSTVREDQGRVRARPELPGPLQPRWGGTVIAVSWYGAAAYCNWLSEQEGLPKGQWCYLPNRDGAYDAGMSIPADVLKRTGYRLPTEAEWEYACRSGTITSRYYGVSTDLLGKYAWYQANSREHAWPGGSLIPNESGLFDMLGNVFEWVQDRYGRHINTTDDINMQDSIDTIDPRLLRGGAFSYRPAYVRSADRNGLAPSLRSTDIGFRPSRTYH